MELSLSSAPLTLTLPLKHPVITAQNLKGAQLFPLVSEEDVTKGDRESIDPQKLGSLSNLLSTFCLVPGHSSRTS